MGLDSASLHKTIKPVLKKNVFHFQQNAIIVFKSIEITIQDEERLRTYQTIYVPLNLLEQYTSGSAKAIELQIIQSLNFNCPEKGFIFSPISIPQKNPLEEEKHDSALPELIDSSFLI